MGQSGLVFRDRNIVCVVFFLNKKVCCFGKVFLLVLDPTLVQGSGPGFGKDPPQWWSPGPRDVRLREIDGTVVNNFLKYPTVHATFIFKVSVKK